MISKIKSQFMVIVCGVCFRCRRQLRKNMFYPEYVDMEMEVLGEIMEMEMNKFLHEELPCHMSAAISSMCKDFFLLSNF